MKPRKYTRKDGTITYKLNKTLHREDGPAVIYTNGTKKWYDNGICHREDGPAIIWWTGKQEWVQYGELHREDGPAIEWASGDKSYYIGGIRYNALEYWIAIEAMQ